MTQHVASTRIVIADDHPIFRDGLRRLLESEQGYQIVGEAVDAITAVTLVREHTPDILLLDLFMPYGGGIAALRDLAIDPPSTRIILLTAAIEPGEIVTAVHLGARGIITKDSATALLFKCIQRVIAGEYWLDRGAVGDLVQALVAAGAQEGRRAGPPPLTRRELEIIATVVEGASNREVADRFGLSPQTVKNHLSNIFDKLGRVQSPRAGALRRESPAVPRPSRSAVPPSRFLPLNGRARVPGTCRSQDRYSRSIAQHSGAGHDTSPLQCWSLTGRLRANCTTHVHRRECVARAAVCAGCPGARPAHRRRPCGSPARRSTSAGPACWSAVRGSFRCHDTIEAIVELSQATAGVGDVRIRGRVARVTQAGSLTQLGTTIDEYRLQRADASDPSDAPDATARATDDCVSR